MLLGLIFALPSATPSTAAAEAWVRKAHGRLPYSLAPGLAAVINAGGHSHTFGVGVQKHGESVPTDGDTLFEIGSLSKTAVALGLATLVTAGRLRWNDPVRRWLGEDFKLGSEEYVSSTLTVSDLLAHRTGLAEGQGDLLSYVYPTATGEYQRRLADVEPVHALRSTFDCAPPRERESPHPDSRRAADSRPARALPQRADSNTGWMLAGQVLRYATNSSSWCAALRATLLVPLGLTRTFCHRNEIPPEVAAAHLAAVHKADPCRSDPRSAVPAVATFDFVATGDPDDFAWGAADAAGSVVSSASDMGRVIGLLLGTASSPIVSRAVVGQMLTGQMVTPAAWLAECGIAGWGAGGTRSVGRAAAAGFGFDVVTELRLGGRDRPYAEKNGDTNMHKARLGLLPSFTGGAADGEAVLLLSNLGGSMGGPLTALKFGVLALLAGGSDADADAAAAAALSTTGFWAEQWRPEVTCTPCGRSGASGPCSPGGHVAPPLPPSAYVGAYGTRAYGEALLTVESAATAAGGPLLLSLGPIRSARLDFSNTSTVLERPCSELGAELEAGYLAPWAVPAARRLAALGGDCTLAEWTLPAEIPAAGISAGKGTVAFPWGCGPVPLPDGPSVYLASHQGRGRLAVFMGEALEAANAMSNTSNS